MAIPADAIQWGQALDPSDKLDYRMENALLLGDGETIASMTLTLLPEAAALGLTILASGSYAPAVVDGTDIVLWFEIDPAQRGNAAFEAGALLPMELTIITNSTPERRFQRTWVLKAIQL